MVGIAHVGWPMGKRPTTFHEAMLQDLELALEQAQKVARVEALRKRISGEVRPAPVSHTPIHFERPVKGYRLPSLSMWHRWLESRQGDFMLNGVVHTLCLSCGFPIPVSSGEKSVWGARDKKTLKEGKGNRVTVGALVKWNEETVSVHGVYNPKSPTYLEVEEETVVRLVTASGLGCSECLLHMAKVTGTELRSYEKRLADHTEKYGAWERSIAAYRVACQTAGITPDPNVVSPMGIATPPKAPTPYILVDPKNIETEKTIWHFNPTYGVSDTPFRYTDLTVTATVAPDKEYPVEFLWKDIAYAVFGIPEPTRHSYTEPITTYDILDPAYWRAYWEQYRGTVASRESGPSKRIIIPLIPVGICHHARGVTPVVKAGRRPGVYE